MDTNYLAQLIMYFVFMFAIVAYATLDGFDLGVGCLHLFARGDRERRLMINAIGPVWDGNSTWIVIGGGVLFAAFPKAFSIMAPNFYTPFMFMLLGFMLRAASIEFRSKGHQSWWPPFWDGCFFAASLLVAFIVGMILGNLIQGVPLNDKGEVVGGIFGLMTFYPLLIAFFGISCFAMHGSLYLLMKTEGAFHDRVRKWSHICIAVFLVFWLAATVATFISYPHMTKLFFKYPVIGVFPLMSLVCIANIPLMIRKKQDGNAFFFSCLSIFFLMALFVIGTFPNLVLSTIHPGHSLTFMNSSVSELALWIMVGVTCTGAPLSFFYFPYIYKVFKGKIQLDAHSY